MLLPLELEYAPVQFVLVRVQLPNWAWQRLRGDPPVMMALIVVILALVHLTTATLEV